MARSPKRPAGVLVVRRSRRTEEEPPPPRQRDALRLEPLRPPPPQAPPPPLRLLLAPPAAWGGSPTGLPPPPAARGTLLAEPRRAERAAPGCAGDVEGEELWWPSPCTCTAAHARVLRVRALGGGLPEGERHQPGLGLSCPVEEDVDRRVPVPATTSGDKGLSSLSPTGPAPPPAQASRHCICRRLAATRARGGKLGGGFVAATHRCQVLDAPTPLFSSLLSESWYSPQHSRTLSFRPLRPFWGLGTVG